MMTTTGEMKVGAISNVMKGGMKFNPTILVVNKGKEYRWLGPLACVGIFDGEHYFVLDKVSTDHWITRNQIDSWRKHFWLSYWNVYLLY